MPGTIKTRYIHIIIYIYIYIYIYKGFPLLSQYLVALSHFSAHSLNFSLQEHLEIGPDGCYYERRNYNRVDNDLLGEGGFGMVYACHDIRKETLFAIKCNNQSTEDKTTTMAKECDMLNSIGPHGHITRYFGSLVDDYGPEAIQGEMCKMLMECATSKCTLHEHRC